jgi:hypothetical protein
MKLSPAELRNQRPRHFPALPDFCESWSVANPNGIAIHFPSKQEALDTAELWAYQVEVARL